jgi:copper resistance protein C
MNRRIITGFIVALLLSLGLFNMALAHAKLVSSDPAAGAKLTSAPAKITLVFDEEIDATESKFTVADAKGALVGEGKLDTNDLDHKTLTGTLKAGTGDGVYMVSWQTLTPDDNGHSEGAFTFGVNVDPGAQPTAVPDHDEATATPAPTGTARPTASGAAQPTAASTAQPTATAGGSPAALPQTGAGDTHRGGYLLLAAALALGAGIALRRGKLRAGR